MSALFFLQAHTFVKPEVHSRVKESWSVFESKSKRNTL